MSAAAVVELAPEANSDAENRAAAVAASKVSWHSRSWGCVPQLQCLLVPSRSCYLLMSLPPISDQ